MKVTAVIVGAIATAGIAVGAAAVNDSHQGRDREPGPNGDNTRGLCTAYLAGSEKGREHKRKAPPFRALEAAAGGADGVEEYCAEHATKRRD